MKFIPHDYQQRAVDLLLRLNNVGLFMSMGTGKTATTLLGIMKLKYEYFLINKVLIVAPKKVAEGTWQAEIEKWDNLSFLRCSTILGTARQRMKALETDADIYIINRENVPWLVDTVKNAWPFEMVVLDESSSFKNHQSQRFKAIRAMLPHIKRMVLLTGTPSPNGMMDLWAQVYLLDRGERLEKYITRYRERYFYPDRVSYQTGQVFSYSLKPGGDEAIMKKISDICISMEAKDYLTLPDCIDHIFPVILDDKARKNYKELEKKMVLEVAGREDEIAVTSAAALTNKLLQLSNGAIYDEEGGTHEIHNCKLEALDELLESLGGQPVLLFYAYQSDRDRILDRFAKRYRTRVLTDASVDVPDWNSGMIDILLAHPASCAYGLNLQQGGSHVVWFGLTWNYELYAQANKRLHRQGQKNTVIIHHLVCKDTRDEDVMNALQHKDEAQAYVMESLKARIRQYD